MYNVTFTYLYDAVVQGGVDDLIGGRQNISGVQSQSINVVRLPVTCLGRDGSRSLYDNDVVSDTFCAVSQCHWNTEEPYTASHHRQRHLEQCHQLSFTWIGRLALSHLSSINWLI